MLAVILQPGYLPWLGFFEQLYRSDAFVVYDDVQYDKEGWRNRNRIKTAKGVQWLTVPVLASFSDRSLIKDVKIDNKINWRKKHLFSISQNYSKAPFFKDYIGVFEEAYSKEWDKLIDIDNHFIIKLAQSLGITDKKIVKSSEFSARGDRTTRLINICKQLGADMFYEGALGRNYLDEDSFIAEDIRIEFQDYKHPQYNQLYGDFISHLSVIDLLFNHGPKSLSILINKKM